MSCVLVIPDCHCPGMRRGFVDFLKRIADEYGIDRVVHIGDLVDWSSINFHEKNPCLRNPQREFKRAKRQVATIAKAFPKADWMIGNHDALTERQAVYAGMPTDVLKRYDELWEVDWKVHQRYATLTIDGALYSHGESGRGGQDAAYKQAKDNFQSTVIGHWHTQAGVKWWANPEFLVFGMNVGCGIDYNMLRFEYGRRVIAKPILGCGIVINGKQAYFEPWLLGSR